MHAGMWHLFSNMIGLIVFGNLLERFWGSRRFLFFYMVTGLGSGLLYWGVQFYQMQKMEQRISAYSAAPSPQAFNSFMLKYAPNKRLQLMEAGFVDEYEEFPSNAAIIKATKQWLRGVYDYYANIPMVGASGAIFGIIMAFGLLFPNTELFYSFRLCQLKQNIYLSSMAATSSGPK